MKTRTITLDDKLCRVDYPPMMSGSGCPFLVDVADRGPKCNLDDARLYNGRRPIGIHRTPACLAARKWFRIILEPSR